MGIWYVLLSVLLLACESTSWPQKPVPSRRTFTAAVLEYHPVTPTVLNVTTRDEALELMNRNLDEYAKYAKKAAIQHADILVYPEGGMNSHGFIDRASLMHFAEPIPDSKSITWNPCLEKKLDHTPHDVQTRLSCIALTNRLYLVANMAERRSCLSSDHKCPHDGHYLFNTNIVYNPYGVLIAKYRKRHLYGEKHFNYPESADEIFFDTPFGRFGTFICFDILFKDPAIDIIEKFRVDTVVYSANWVEYEALPVLSSIGTHSAFAISKGVNVLAANGNGVLSTGSGIYTPNATSVYFRDGTKARSKLVIATIESYPRSPLRRTPSVNIPYTKGEFTSLVGQYNSDLADFTRLLPDSTNASVCYKTICCRALYSMVSNPAQQETYALGAFEGIHTNSGMYIQVCVLLLCTDSHTLSSCGTPINPSSTVTTRFTYLQLSGQFNSSSTFPQFIVARDRNLALPNAADSWTFDGSSATAPSGFSDPLITATLYTRPYERDLPINYTEWTTETQSHPGTTEQTLPSASQQTQSSASSQFTMLTSTWFIFLIHVVWVLPI